MGLDERSLKYYLRADGLYITNFSKFIGFLEVNKLGDFKTKITLINLDDSNVKKLIKKFEYFSELDKRKLCVDLAQTNLLSIAWKRKDCEDIINSNKILFIIVDEYDIKKNAVLLMLKK